MGRQPCRVLARVLAAVALANLTACLGGTTGEGVERSRAATECARRPSLTWCPDLRSVDGGSCVDLNTARAACGACGRQCEGDSHCERGRCECDGGRITCPGRDQCAIDSATSRDHCGGCGRRCGDDARCIGGRCVACPSGQLVCGLECVPTRDNRYSCGACDRRCDSTSECADGRCRTCASGATLCANACVSQQSDPNNCGGCGNRCPVGARCAGGRCACASGLIACAGASTCGVDPRVDPAHCGACENRCAPEAACEGGRCVGDELRLLTPSSAMVTLGPRPWFRWTLPRGAVGARVEVCGTPDCRAPESTTIVEGNRMRPDAPLRPGRHFWRVAARRADGSYTPFSVPWELEVSASSTHRGIADVNGDGITDRFDRSSAGLEVYLGRTSGSTPTPDQTIPLPSGDSVGELVMGGDIDGDGYGDVLLTARRRCHSGDGRSHPDGSFLMFCFGGPLGLRSCSPTGVSAGPECTFNYASVLQVGPAGDLDGNGAMDIVAETIVGVYGGSRYHIVNQVATRVADAVLYMGTLFEYADTDADGRDELFASYSDVPTFEETWPRASRRICVSPIGTDCPTYQIGGHSVAIDHNDDGYDDVLYGCVFLGGPGGLAPTRCQVP